MNRINEAKRAALDAGEAALLPAMPRNRGTGTAALRNALQAAAAMKEMQVSNRVNTSQPLEAGQQRLDSREDAREVSVPYSSFASRAALHHILKR